MAPRPISRLLLGTFPCVVLVATWFAAARASMTAPADVAAEELGVIDFTVLVSLHPTVTLVADLSGLPAGAAATFTTSPDDLIGTFHWVPDVGMSGSYVVTFQAFSDGFLAYTLQTKLDVIPEGTTALTRGRYIWMAGEGIYEVSFVASDQGGTSTLTVPLSVTNHLNCFPDARDQNVERAHPRPGRVGSLQGAIASAPTMSWSGNPDGEAWCVFYTYWENPIDLVVEAISRTPESGLALTCVGEQNCPYFGQPCGFSTELLEKDPRVTAPVTAQGDITAPLTIYVDAGDPDGDPISSLTADLSLLPPGNDAVFTDDPDHTHGVLTWTPALADSGNYSVEFRASNRFTSSQTTAIHVRGFNVTGVPAGSAGRVPAFSAVVRPNPLSADSRLQLVTTRPGPVRVRLFDVRGRLMREVLAKGNVDPGEHRIPLGMEDRLGRQLRSGVYFYRVEAAEGVLTGRLAVLK